MFIKKDTRKINEILEDQNDNRESMKLSKRSAEFLGNIDVLNLEVQLSAYCNLKVLNLYDNHLTSLEGIGYLSQTPIEEINLGCNDLDKLPIEFGHIVTLKTLWLDDNNFEVFPVCICLLKNLTSLRFSSNKLTLENLPLSISQLNLLETLALDNNSIEFIPEVLWTLTSLKHLWLRQNPLTSISKGIFCLSNLQTLSLSSCSLSSLPSNNYSELSSTEEATQLENTLQEDDMEYEYDDITTQRMKDYTIEFGERDWSSFQVLKSIYLNGNKLNYLPVSFSRIPLLETLNLANNLLLSLPSPWDKITSSQLINGVVIVNTQQSNVSNDNEMEIVTKNQEVKITLLGNNKLFNLDSTFTDNNE